LRLEVSLFLGQNEGINRGIFIMKTTGNSAKITNGGRNITQKTTYETPRNKTEVTIHRDRNGGNPRITGINEKTKQ
jgi:hypothetical protein